MAKSLIRTVDGIGIWVRDGYIRTVDWTHTEIIVAIAISVIIFLLLPFLLPVGDIYGYGFTASIAVVLIMVVGGLGSTHTVDAYMVYGGSNEYDGIRILKTSDDKADQIAICKAAQEIESRCHEIAAKRAELDRIAASCK